MGTWCAGGRVRRAAAAALAAIAWACAPSGAGSGSPPFDADSLPPLELAKDSAALAAFTPCVVTRITDGDTIRCQRGARVRLLLIDAPELDQGELGERARAALARLVAVGSTVRLERDVQPLDQYGRVLAYVYLADGRQVNEAMVRLGYAEVLVYPPNVKFVDAMRRARARARGERRGLWAVEAFACAPRDHRAHRCD